MGPTSITARVKSANEVAREFLCSSESPMRPRAVKSMRRTARRPKDRNQNHQSIGGIPDTSCAAGFAVRTCATNALTKV